MSYRILITGSRMWDDQQVIEAAIRRLGEEWDHPQPPTVTLVHGDARGADRLGARVAEKIGMRIESHPADWSTHGKAAGFIRNQVMVDLGADVCLTFALTSASGTGHCARAARRAGIRTIDYGAPTKAAS